MVRFFYIKNFIIEFYNYKIYLITSFALAILVNNNKQLLSKKGRKSYQNYHIMSEQLIFIY